VVSDRAFNNAYAGKLDDPRRELDLDSETVFDEQRHNLFECLSPESFVARFYIG
jgi:hypothetical protein